MARTFSGSTSSDRVIVGNYSAINSVNTMTLAAWQYRTGAGGGNSGKLCQKADSGEDNGWAWYFDDNNNPQFFCTRYNIPNHGVWKATETVTQNAWHHVALTYNASSTANDPIFYADGTIQTTSETAAPSGSLQNDTNDAEIGNRLSGPHNRCFDGRIAEMGMWNRILTVNEIKSVYYRGVLAVPDGLVLYVPLLGHSPEPNYVDGGNGGTVTGTSIANHAPAPPMFAFSDNYVIPLVSTAASTQKAVGITDITITFST